MEKDKELARVFHYDLYGRREEKYSFLLNNNLQTVPWRELELTDPQYFFTLKDFSLQGEYEKGFSVQELFPVNSTGIVTARDNFTIHNTGQEVKNTINEFTKLDIETARDRFDLGKDVRDWSVAGAKRDLTINPDFGKIVEISYRPFDKRFTYYTGNSRGFHCMPRGNVMRHFLKGRNVGLVFRRQQPQSRDLYLFCTQNIIADGYIRSDNKGGESVAPLYLYVEGDIVDGRRMPDKKIPNLNKTIMNEMCQRIGLQFTDEKTARGHAPLSDAASAMTTFAPIDVLDYIYAVLHSPTYRERYKEFLKIDFPRVPYPQDATQFWTLVESGGKLRRLHLMEGVEPQEGMADFPIAGSNEVEKPEYTVPDLSNGEEFGGRVYINNTQYFDNVPLVSWNFYIGGYQPAQKWLKDRKGRTLGYDDIRHYQKIINVLEKTHEIMKTI